jgi:hypothetical protein
MEQLLHVHNTLYIQKPLHLNHTQFVYASYVSHNKQAVFCWTLLSG